MDSSLPRRYYPIWNDLKTSPDHTARIAAPRALHKRIVKAVIKEKWMDLGYKLELGDKKATLWHSSQGGVLKFILTFSITEEDF